MIKVVRIKPFLIVLVLILIIGTVLGAISFCFAERYDDIPIYCTDDEKRIAISFDAAWGADKTTLIVDTCKNYGIEATFFLTGFWIDDYPEEVKYIFNNGFEVGNHSRNHYDMARLSEDKMKSELEYVNEKVKELTGVIPKVFRPPFGSYSKRLVSTVQKLGMSCIQWSVDSLDWKGLSKEELTERVLKNLKGGDIILCHNNSDHIVEALPEIIEGALSKGLSFVKMSDLIYKDNYIIDNTGKQIFQG